MLKQKFVTQFGSNIIVKIVTMIAGIFVARIAGPHVLGTISYGIAFVSIWGFINTIFAAGHMKLVSEGQNHGDCITTYVYLKGISVVAFIVIVLVWLFLQINFGNLSFESPEQIYVILIMLSVSVVSQLYRIISNSYTAMLMQAKANFPNLITTIVFHFGRIAVVLMGGRAIGLSLWELAVLFLLFPLLFKYYKELPHGKWNKSLARKYYKYGVPTLLTSIIASVVHYSDKLILAHFTNIEELGYYTAAMAVGGSFMLLSNSIGTIFFPLFSKLISENNWDMVNKKNSSYQTFSALFIFPLIALIVIISEPLMITFLGERYISSILPFKIIVAATYFVITGMPYGNIITGMGRFYVNVWINASHFLVFIGSVIFFVSPKYLDLGATGLALNLMITYIYKNAMYIMVANKIGSLKYIWGNFYRIVLILLVSFVFYALSNRIAEITFWWLYIIPIYLFFTYFILYLFNLMKFEHILVLLEILNLKKTIRYIDSELRKKKND
jgi:O-antigen/teichoic acid export membrane protein